MSKFDKLWTARCGGLNRPAKLNAFSPPTAPSTIFSTCAAIGYRLPSIGLLVKKRLTLGRR
jgi:hypothetical protein